MMMMVYDGDDDDGDDYDDQLCISAIWRTMGFWLEATGARSARKGTTASGALQRLTNRVHVCRMVPFQGPYHKKQCY